MIKPFPLSVAPQNQPVSEPITSFKIVRTAFKIEDH